MAIPARRLLRVASYIIKPRSRNQTLSPGLMLESPSAAIWPVQVRKGAVGPPTFSRGSLPVKECLDAMNECDAPIGVHPRGRALPAPNIG